MDFYFKKSKATSCSSTLMSSSVDMAKLAGSFLMKRFVYLFFHPKFIFKTGVS
jgi:hypothetical protein